MLSHVRSSWEYLRAARQLPWRRQEGRGDVGAGEVAGGAAVLGRGVGGDGGGERGMDLRLGLELPQEA